MANGGVKLTLLKNTSLLSGSVSGFVQNGWIEVSNAKRVISLSSEKHLDSSNSVPKRQCSGTKNIFENRGR